MRTFLVGYDLNRPGQDYAALIAKLKSYGTYWHYLDSTWLIRAEGSAVDIRDALMSLIDATDELIVVDVTGDAAAWVGFDKRAADWIIRYL
jgi:hypothetical protein